MGPETVEEVERETLDLALTEFEHYIAGMFFLVRLKDGRMKLEARTVRANHIDKRVSRNSIKLLGRSDVTFEELATMLAMAKKGGFSDEAKQYFLDGLNGFIDRPPAEIQKTIVARRLQPGELIVDKYLFGKMWLSMIRSSVEHYIATPQASITKIGLMLGLKTPEERKAAWENIRSFIREQDNARKSKVEEPRRNDNDSDLDAYEGGGVVQEGEGVSVGDDLIGADGGAGGHEDGKEGPADV